MPRLAFSEPSIGSTTSHGGPPPRTSFPPSSSETSVNAAPVASRRATTTRSAASSIAVVWSPPTPAPTTGSRSARPGSSPSTPRTSSTAARQAASQSVKRVEEQPGDELRGEVGRLLGQDLAAPGPLEDVRHRRRPDEERRLRLAAVDGGLRLLAARRVADVLRAGAVDDIHVEPVAFDQPVAAAAVDDDARQLVAGPLDLAPVDVTDASRDPARGQDREPRIRHRHEDDRDVHPRLDRRLVAMMAVGDQQLTIGEDSLDVDRAGSSQPDALRLDLRRAADRDGRRALVEQENRLELCADRAEQ